MIAGSRSRDIHVAKKSAQMRITVPRPVVDTQELAFQQQVLRGVEACKSQIVGVLGRQKFTSVRIGITDTKIGPRPQVKLGYTVLSLPSSAKPKVNTVIAQAIGLWLQQCHGARCEYGRGGIDPLPAGETVMYIAVKSPAMAR